MKFFTPLFIALFFVNSAMATQDTIPNGGFENWTFSGTYYDPSDWTTLNPLTGIVSVYTATRDSVIVHSGHYSIKLVTKSVAGQTAPGLVTTGTVNTNNNTITGGIPIASRPTAVMGWYQYAPSGADTAGFSISLTKWDAVGDSEILVGRGGAYGMTNNTWAQLTMPVQYFSAATPDTVLLLFTSSNGAGQVNSALWLDDLSYSYLPLGIGEVANNTINIYPNPASQVINIDNQNIKATSLNLYAADGRLVKAIEMHEGMNSINVAALPAGFYILGGTGINGSVYHSSVVIDK